MNEKSDLAFLVASVYHAGAKYGDYDYTYHLEKVASHFDDDKMKSVAYLHDTLEDTELTFDKLGRWFGWFVADTVQCLTRGVDEEYKNYIVRISKNDFARKIKIADIQENMKNNAKESLMKRYSWALEYLGTH